MTLITLVSLAGGILATAIVLGVLFRTLFPPLLQKSFLDLTERLGKHAWEAQERLDRALAQNRQELQQGLARSTQALESKFQSLETQVSTRLDNIGRSVESKLQENLKEGFRHFEKVQEHLKAAELKLASLNTVGQSISDLNSLLKLPHLRGGFGEASLERILADFLPASLFELQYVVAPGSTERVDAIVRFARLVLPIDSKFPREQVLPLFEASDEGSLQAARATLSQVIMTQARSIAAKYIRPEHGTTDMALLYLPSETLYFEVIRNGSLFESLARLKVFPVSPNTLSISLHSVAMAQEYYEMARGVEKTIEDVRKARRHFEHFEKKFDEIGKGLRRAQDAFETAQTHLTHYETSVYRLIGETAAAGDLGAATATTLSEEIIQAPGPAVGQTSGQPPVEIG
jgi:DNA recombination protein RmuC